MIFFRKCFTPEFKIEVDVESLMKLPDWYEDYLNGGKVGEDVWLNLKSLFTMIAQVFRLTPDEINKLEKEFFIED